MFSKAKLEDAPRNGRSKRLIEMRLADRIWRGKIDTTDSEHCIKAAPTATQRLAIADVDAFAEWVYPRLHTACDEADATAERLAKATTPSDEVHISQIIRPELFTTPEVAGLSIPGAVTVNGSLTKVWRVCLPWTDGRCECVIPSCPWTCQRVGNFGVTPHPGFRRMISRRVGHLCPETAGWTVKRRLTC